MAVIDAADFAAMAMAMSREDAQRDELIKRSRDVLKLSKNAVYALHRGDAARAAGMIAEAKAIAARDLLPLVAAAPSLRGGALSAALEEWAEAAIFAAFVAGRPLPTIGELEIVTREEYLGGVMDFTGELGRYAVLRATARDGAGVERCRDVCDALFEQFLSFEWRNGGLRRKFDAVKYTVKKVEQIIYELSLAGAGVTVAPKSSPEADGVPGEGHREGGAADGGDDAEEEEQEAAPAGGGGDGGGARRGRRGPRRK